MPGGDGVGFGPTIRQTLRADAPSRTSTERMLVGNWAHYRGDLRSPSGSVRTSITFHGDSTYTENVQISIVGLPDFLHSGSWRVRDGRLELRVEATTDARALPLLTTVSHEITLLNDKGLVITHEKTGEEMGHLRQ
jgi:hypothetical protein